MPALGKLDLCVLNSTSIVERSKDFLSRYEKVHAFLDNDAPGREALRKMRHFLPKGTVLVNEAERLYPSCNDFNEFCRKSSARQAGGKCEEPANGTFNRPDLRTDNKTE